MKDAKQIVTDLQNFKEGFDPEEWIELRSEDMLDVIQQTQGDAKRDDADQLEARANRLDSPVSSIRLPAQVASSLRAFAKHLRAEADALVKTEEKP